MNNDSLVQRLAWLIAFGITGAGFIGVYNSRFESRMAWAFVALGIAIAIFGHFWPTLQARYSEGFIAGAGAVASDFRIWFIVVAGILIYAMGYSILLTVQRDNLAEVIQKDIIPFRLALQKWVVPRHLTAQQREDLENYLKGTTRSETINITINQNDPDASGFAQDLRNAIEGGGWTIKLIDYEKDMRPGLVLDVRFPKGVSQPSRNDPRNPPPEQILRNAMREAKIQIDSVSTGGGPPDLQEVIVTIKVGPRRTGSDAEIQEWPF